MSTITVSTIDNDDELVIAEYYQFEDGWVTFKTADGKAVASYPEKLVTKILSNTPQPAPESTKASPTVHISPAPLDQTTAQMAEKLRARAAKWDIG